MLKYFTQTTYTTSDLEALKHEKRELSLKHHPDRGGTSEDFVAMMAEFAKIEKSLNQDGIFKSNVEEVKVNFEDAKTSYNSEAEFDDLNNSFEETATFVKNAFLTITRDSFIFSRTAFKVMLSVLVVLGTINSAFLAFAILTSVIAKEYKYAIMSAIMSATVIAFFHVKTLVILLDGTSSFLTVENIVTAAILAPLAYFVKLYFTIKDE